jgi:hypothetical protein
MSQPVSQETILQAILELSNQLKETKAELKGEIKNEIAGVRADLRRLEEKVDLFDTKMDIIQHSLLDAQADILKLKRASIAR